MTDVNSVQYHSTSPRMSDGNNNSFILNQSNVPMDIDDEDDLGGVTHGSNQLNGHHSPALSDPIENETDQIQEKTNLSHQGNPVLNKSFDVLPQIKDDDTPYADPLTENNDQNNNILDTTVELPNNHEELEDKLTQEIDALEPLHHVRTTAGASALLSNQFSLEYPYVVPQPAANVRSSSPEAIETVTALTKTMKLNVNKPLEGQEPSTPTSITDKAFDTNTFVLKKKERRKATTPVTESSFNAATGDTPPDLCNKQSPFNTPSGSLDGAIASRSTATTLPSQAPSVDPMRVM